MKIKPKLKNRNNWNLPLKRKIKTHEKQPIGDATLRSTPPAPFIALCLHFVNTLRLRSSGTTIRSWPVLSSEKLLWGGRGEPCHRRSVARCSDLVSLEMPPLRSLIWNRWEWVGAFFFSSWSGFLGWLGGCSGWAVVAGWLLLIFSPICDLGGWRWLWWLVIVSLYLHFLVLRSIQTLEKPKSPPLNQRTWRLNPSKRIETIESYH